jgi:hypothetical protein
MPLYMVVKNPFVTSDAVKPQLKNVSQAGIEKFTARLKAAGHDGAAMAFSNAPLNSSRLIPRR